MEKDISDSSMSSTPSRSKAPPSYTEEELDPISIPDYELLKPIGKGSYGTVWLARNVMGVYRAVKIIYRKSFTEKTPYERELSGIRSFEPISRSHEGLVDILHVGINPEKGCFYYIMELGDDENTKQEIDVASYSPTTLQKKIQSRGTLPFDDCLQLGIVLSDALVALHKRRLVHRDVKPSNIIFVNGVPKLADIGLVAGIGEAASYVGTQGFIPPEGPGSEQADIFSLGKVLYEASTGKDRQEFPDLPTGLYDLENRDQLMELNEVVIQACQNDCKKRYQSAWDMHSDLLVIAKGESVKRLKILEQRFVRLKRWALVSVLAISAAIVVGYPIYREKRTASAAHAQQVGTDVGYGNGVVESGDMLGALPYFAEALRLEQGKAEETAQRLRFGSTLAQAPKLERVWSIAAEVSDCRMSPDNKRILIGRLKGGLEIHSLSNAREPSQIFGGSGAIGNVDYSSDGRLITAGSADLTNYVWSTSDNRVAKQFVSSAGAFSAKFSADNHWVAIAYTNNLIKVWPLKDGSDDQPLVLKGHTAKVRFATFSHNGNYLASASEDGTVRLWDLKTGLQVGRPFEHGRGQWVYSVAFSPDDRRIATACLDHKARIWDVASGEQLFIDMRHDDVVTSVDFSPDGRLILTASLDGTARLWRADNGQAFSANLLLHHPSGVQHASFSSDGERVATACCDGTVSVWNLAGCLVPPNPVNEFYSGDGSRFLCVSNENIVTFNATSRTEVAKIAVKGIRLTSATLNRNGQYVLACLNTEVRILRATTGDMIGPTIAIPPGSQSMLLSDDGSKLAACYSNLIRIWDVPNGANISIPLAKPGPFIAASFQPNGLLLATAYGTKLCLWNTTNGQPAFPPLRHPRLLTDVEFSPDGKYVATSCYDQQIVPWYAQVWSTSTGAPVGKKMWHADGVLSVSFSPDSKRVVTGGEDHKAIIWDVNSGKRLGNPLKHAGKVIGAVFSSDGKWVLTSCDDGTIRLWDAETGGPLTPPMLHWGGGKEVKLIPGSYEVIAVGSDKKASIWKLPVDQRPVNDLRQLAGLLAGEVSLLPENLPTNHLSTPEAVWYRLQALYPEGFKVSPGEVKAWEEFGAQQAQNERQRIPGAFYATETNLSETEDITLPESVEEAKKHLTEDVH